MRAITNIDNGQTVFETDLIPPGKYILWTPGSKLKEGTYHLSFLQTPYWQQETNGEYTSLTSGTNDITLTIKKGEY